MIDTDKVLFIRWAFKAITVFESVSMGSKLSGLGQASTSRTNFASCFSCRCAARSQQR